MPRHVPQRLFCVNGLNVLTYATMQRLITTPLNFSSVEQMAEFLCAVGVQPVKRSGRFVGDDVALDRPNKLFESFVGNKLF